MEWLVSIDAYTEDVLRQQAIKTTNTAGQLGLAVILPDSGSLASEERYLCARFVKYLFEQKSPFIADLCRLASVGLLTEVIQDFQKPITKVNRTNLNIYLDAPVALDLLGVSGNASAANIRPIIKKLQDIGASIRIFKVSVEELQRVLDAVLRRNPPERTGPTADAIRRNEVYEAYVRQVARDPESTLAEYQVSVIDRKLEQYPNEHEHFSREQYDELFAKMTWHLEVSRREHDATVIAQVMRMRGGKQSPDLFQTRHILITRNALLAQLGRRFCVNNDLISERSASPSIHQRQLATAVWLRTGLDDGEQDIPRRYLLAACERVLELKKGVIDQVRIVTKNLTPEKAEQLDLLLTQDRSAQLLMDKTLGSSNIVSSSNIEGLIEGMKQSLVQDIQGQAEKEVVAAQREADVKVRKAYERRREAEKEASQLGDSLSALSTEDRELVNRLLQDANVQARHRRWSAKCGIGLLIFLVGALPLFAESTSGLWKLIFLIAGGVIAAIFSFFQIFDRPMGLERLFEKWSRMRLKKLATQRGMAPKLARHEISYSEGVLALRAEASFSLLQPPDQQRNVTPKAE